MTDDVNDDVADEPWLRIPAEDYEAHMRAVGQDVALREAFARVLAETRPARVAVLGCTTGADLAQLAPQTTELAVGVDLNPDYLSVASERLRPRWGERVHLVCADVATAELPPGPYDLVHAALLLEYVPPDVLFRRAHDWLGPSGMLSLVTQEPVEGLPAVTDAGVESLHALAARMTLRAAAEVAAQAAESGFVVEAQRTVTLASGKKLTSFLLDKARASLGRRRGRARC
jgi:SAM-dependent methyltransferase